MSSSFVASMISSLITDGVVNVDGSELAVVPGTGLSVKMKPGCAWMKGYMARLGLERTFDLSSGHEYTVVIRQNYGIGECTLCVFEDDYGSPVRFNGIFDLVVAKIVIPEGALAVTSSMITDTRNDNSLCGFVRSKARLS